MLTHVGQSQRSRVEKFDFDGKMRGDNKSDTYLHVPPCGI